MNSPHEDESHSVAEPDPHDTDERSLKEQSVSDWTLEDDASPKDQHRQPSAHQQTANIKQNLISNRHLGWTFLLVAVAILGNLLVPITLEQLYPLHYVPQPQPFPEGSVIEWVSYYFKTAFRAGFFGLWFAEYVALWLWINSYVASKITRWLLGLFLCTAIAYTVILGMSIAWGPAPTDFFWFCLLGSLGLYATIHLLLNLLLSRSRFYWRPIQLGAGSRYSIRALLGTMIGSAVLMLGLKLFPYDSAGMRAKSILDFIPLTIWLAWLALGIATLIWLQLGSLFGTRRSRFLLSFFALAIFGPIGFHLIGAWLLAWNPGTTFTIDFEQFVIVYSIEVGLIVGVALMLPLLPRRAVGTS